MPTSNKALSRWTLRLDGTFLLIAGSVALLADTVGHFFGVGPLAQTFGSPYTIGSGALKYQYPVEVAAAAFNLEWKDLRRIPS